MKVELKNTSLIRVEFNDQDISDIEKKVLEGEIIIKENGVSEKRPVEIKLAKQEEYIKLKTSPPKTKINKSEKYSLTISKEGYITLIDRNGYIITNTGPSSMDTVEMKYKK